MGSDYNLDVVAAFEQRGESWEDMTLRGNRLLPTCQEQIVNIPADPHATASISVPAQATAPDPWEKVNRYHWNEDGRPCRDANCGKSHWIDGHSLDAALAAERAKHQEEIERLKLAWREQDQALQDIHASLGIEEQPGCPADVARMVEEEGTAARAEHHSLVEELETDLTNARYELENVRAELLTRERAAFIAGANSDPDQSPATAWEIWKETREK